MPVLPWLTSLATFDATHRRSGGGGASGTAPAVSLPGPDPVVRPAYTGRSCLAWAAAATISFFVNAGQSAMSSSGVWSWFKSLRINETGMHVPGTTVLLTRTSRPISMRVRSVYYCFMLLPFGYGHMCGIAYHMAPHVGEQNP